MTIVFFILVLAGIIYFVYSLYNLYLGFKNDNDKQKNYAVLGIAIGILLGLSPLLFIFFAFIFGGNYHE